jgi:hypothetical protein
VVSVDHVWRNNGHRHINNVHVDTDLADESKVHSTSRVVAAVDRGVRYYTIGNVSGVETDLVAFDCSCGNRQIKTEPEDPNDDDLDVLTTNDTIEAMEKVQDWLPARFRSYPQDPL